MAKKYFYITLLFLTFSLSANAQDGKSASTSKSQEPTIEGLSLYPNPNNTGKVYITSRLNLDKKVEVFDVLGKKVIDVTLFSRELNISSLNPGVYIIKIKEGDASATRKLIIN
ncbi:MAG: secretion protein [Flavobacteria bacterium RIFCSPLOWO2_12_FULL_31_7]|nr:MAG: secretion protein [Flavobacteria bacterium RIFCSPLOWO2_12_FULL_31_7]